MNHCRDCKHWLRKGDETVVTEEGTLTPSPHGTCRRVVHMCSFQSGDPRYGTRDRTGVEASQDVAYVIDTEGYHAVLKVTPEFGCVLWEKSP